MHRIICENLRSAYNVGNILRTADALGRGVVLSGYSAPITHKKVAKTALGAEQSVPTHHFSDNQHALNRAKTQNLTLIAAELTDNSISLKQLDNTIPTKSTIHTETGISTMHYALIVGNELLGVEESTLTQCDHITHIPMLGTKASLNVGQAAAICMWELSQT